MSTGLDRRRETAAVLDVAHALVAVVLNRQLHARDSRFVADSLRELVLALHQASRAGVEMPLWIQFDGSRLCYDGHPLDGPSLQARPLLDACAERGVAMLGFASELDADEANRLFDLLLLPQNLDAFRRSNRDAALVAFGVRHVRVTLADPSLHVDDLEPAQGRAIERYQDLASALQHNHCLAHRDQELAFDRTSTAVERTLQEIEEPSLLLSLSLQDDVDRFTVGHSVRVALLALQVARAAGASREQLLHVGTAALMHDIGKSKVPQEVLFKQGRLDEEEWAYMAAHPRLGAQILIEQHEHVDPRTVGAAFCHHMGPTGDGYPEPALSIQPSGTSRLIRVCDVFEALTAVRPYKHALTPIEAYAVMFRTDSAFDPDWLQRFVQTLGLFPVGTRVELDCGAQALVIAQSDDLSRPEVRLLTGPAGGDPLPDQPETVRIGDAIDGRPTAIGGISTHERVVAMPDFDSDDPEAVAGHHVHGACLHPHDDEPDR